MGKVYSRLLVVLFTAKRNRKLSIYISVVPDPMVFPKEDAFQHLWEHLKTYIPFICHLKKGAEQRMASGIPLMALLCHSGSRPVIHAGGQMPKLLCFGTLWFSHVRNLHHGLDIIKFHVWKLSSNFMPGSYPAISQQGKLFFRGCAKSSRPSREVVYISLSGQMVILLLLVLWEEH